MLITRFAYGLGPTKEFPLPGDAAGALKVLNSSEVLKTKLTFLRFWLSRAFNTDCNAALFRAMLTGPVNWTKLEILSFVSQLSQVLKNRKTVSMARFQEGVLGNTKWLKTLKTPLRKLIVTEWAKVRTLSSTEAEKELLDSGLESALRAIRNRIEHFMESRDGMKIFERKIDPNIFDEFFECMPLLPLAAYLTAINEGLYRDLAFERFFQGPMEVYRSFRNCGLNGNAL